MCWKLLRIKCISTWDSMWRTDALSPKWYFRLQMNAKKDDDSLCSGRGLLWRKAMKFNNMKQTNKIFNSVEELDQELSLYLNIWTKEQLIKLGSEKFKLNKESCYFPHNLWLSCTNSQERQWKRIRKGLDVCTWITRDSVVLEVCLLEWIINPVLWHMEGRWRSSEMDPFFSL